MTERQLEPPAVDTADEHPDSLAGEVLDQDPLGIDPGTFAEEPPDAPDAVVTEQED